VGRIIPVAIALGSNLGDSRAHLAYAASRLASLLGAFRLSRPIVTNPEDVPDLQPPFLNAAAVGETAWPARQVLEALLAIELERGRVRPTPHAARTLDLDLVLYGDQMLDEPGLVVPHPRFRARRFVLEPLAEIAPGMVDPATGRTVQELLGRVAGK
jgi:2-amino-4-hydroxy-6-hydroxymethyldihydropteridine diphosphokinase